MSCCSIGSFLGSTGSDSSTLANESLDSSVFFTSVSFFGDFLAGDLSNAFSKLSSSNSKRFPFCWLNPLEEGMDFSNLSILSDELSEEGLVGVFAVSEKSVACLTDLDFLFFAGL
ncbi:hypothetical protein WICPIJ_008571 [Wickerhamomyces pijperi]|uniref:Uncharacterized protein n=1 Tax=Wickerhamomyces pijperi TaxID=599730 RepID=A0A9P8PY53_WICPI|nr:hypothetical protein WICPIJ_008571 [Wickerhamomyces pijperi]